MHKGLFLAATGMALGEKPREEHSCCLCGSRGLSVEVSQTYSQSAKILLPEDWRPLAVNQRVYLTSDCKERISAAHSRGDALQHADNNSIVY